MTALWLMLACTGDAPVSEAPSPVITGPVTGDTMVVAVPFDPGNANPVVAPYALSGFYTQATQPGLVERRIVDGNLTFVPALAESWTWSEDKLALTYVLHEGLTWSDGVPLTTADVDFTFELIFDEQVASNWYSARDRIREIEVVDPLTVTFHFTTPSTPLHLQGNTHFGIVPKHVLHDADRASLRGHETSRTPLSSGPWIIESWSPEEKMVMVPNPNAVAHDVPRLNRVITRVLPEYATRLIELQNGGVDMILSVEVADVADIKKDYPHINVLRSSADSMAYVGWNLQDPALSDLRVRQALTLAIDEDKIIADQYTAGDEVYAQRCTGTVGPQMTGWYAEVEPLGYDPERSRALLAEAGATDLELDLMIQNGIPRIEQAAVRIQAMLKEVGVTLNISALEPNLFAASARKHDFQAMIWAFGNNPKVDPTIKWHTDGKYNWMQLSDPDIDRLLDEAMSTTDLDLAQKNVREVQQRVYDIQPATFLYPTFICSLKNCLNLADSASMLSPIAKFCANSLPTA